MRRLIYGTFWIAIYLTIVLAPLFALLVEAEQGNRGFWREFSVALGFAGLAMMGLQFLLTARFRSITAPFGIDVVYHFHRQISLVAFGLILAHPIILFITSPDTLALLNPFTAPPRAQAGVWAVVALLIVIVTSVKRLDWKISYEPWRISHGILATLAVVLAMGHVVGVGYYINTPWKQALWLTLGLVWISALLYIRVIKPLLLLRRPYTIEEVIEERGDSWSVVLKPDGHKGMNFKPGQFAWLTLWSSPFALQEHPFSFSSSAMDTRQVAITVKELGDFTSTIKNVKPGTRAYLDGPYGVFTVDQQPAPGYVFLAGGVGITPVISILRTLADRRDGRPLLLFYGSKTWDGATFREELDELEERLNLQVIHVLEEPPEGWEGETGFITPQMLAQYLPVNRTELEYFICGPEPMLNAVESALIKLGISLEQTNAERFNLV